MTLLLLACVGPPPLWAGGDVHMGASPHPLLAPELASEVAGVGLVNLEGPIGPGPSAPDGSHLENHPETLARLVEAGVRYVSVENNHRDDRGPSGRRETLQALEDAGLVPITSAPIRDRGRTFVAYDLSAGVPEIPTLTPPAVVVLHTDVRTYLPTPALRETASRAATAGAHTVVVAGSHLVARPYQEGRTHVLAGLGNLVFACPCTDTTDALLARIGTDGPELIPIRAGHGGPATPGDAKGISDLLQAL